MILRVFYFIFPEVVLKMNDLDQYHINKKIYKLLTTQFFVDTDQS